MREKLVKSKTVNHLIMTLNCFPMGSYHSLRVALGVVRSRWLTSGYNLRRLKTDKYFLVHLTLFRFTSFCFEFHLKHVSNSASPTSISYFFFIAIHTFIFLYNNLPHPFSLSLYIYIYIYIYIYVPNSSTQTGCDTTSILSRV